MQAELAARAVDQGLSRAEVVEAVRRARPRRKQAAGKGRGARPVKLPTSRNFRLPGNLKITVEARKGLGRPEAVAALRSALAIAEGEAATAAYAE